MPKYPSRPARDATAAPKPKVADKDLRNSVQSLAKGFRVLECFSHGAEEMTLSEVAEASSLDPGTTFRMLNTLVSLGYIARVAGAKRFTELGRRLDLTARREPFELGDQRHRHRNAQVGFEQNLFHALERAGADAAFREHGDVHEGDIAYALP